MPGIIEGYNYDIFISYRQKDNRHDGWVTEFVDNLKGELESTFKEEISVYFDINPHDGLLETHDVDESLKEKLKCLVFIPIISRTYCDPKSFAWEHEFKAFVELASKDQFGLKVKLPNGNVASRVLPVQIYSLDSADIKLCESVLGSMLRGVEFIYKSAGVNRPLRSIEEKPHENLNNTLYRDQINKVANSIKEIITSLNQNEQRPEKVSRETFKSVSVPRKNNKTAIVAGSIIALALILFLFLFIPKVFKSEEKIEKSIAVLPFKLLSDEPDKQYLADGMMDAITLHLSKIKDLRVIGRTSVEQYRNPTKTTTAIGKELDVEFLLEGSFQKFGDNVKLIVQLIKTGKEGHVWANEYDRNWSDVFAVQSEVAQAVAAELYASITPEEKKLIEKTPTANLTAYDFYQRGREENTKYWIDKDNKEALERAGDLYHEAIKIDSTFALAYTGLAWVYWDKHYWETYFSEKFLDSVQVLVNIALSYDSQLSEAYTLKGSYFNVTGNKEQAIEELNKAIKFNPNDWMAYHKAGLVYDNFDYVKSIEYLHKAKSLYHGSQLPGILRDLGSVYHQVGFYEKAKYFTEEAFKLDKDSLKNYYSLGYLEHQLGNFAKFVESVEKINAIDSTYLGAQTYRYLGEEYMFLHQYDKSLNCFKKWLQKKAKTLTDQDFFGLHRVGWAYLKEGDKKEAEHYFNELIKYCEKVKELGRVSIDKLRPAYDLAGAYAIMGNRDEAYENLRIWAKMAVCPLWWLTYLKYDPLFDSIRNETEFQQIVKEMEAKYQAEHERVRKWLEEQEML